MAAHVLHIGMDDCHRVAVLRSAGYRVEECYSLLQLATALERTQDAGAVILTESDNISSEQTVALARECSAVPVIFFRKSNGGTGEEQFDLVIQPLTAPEKWLQEVGDLLRWGRGVRVNSQTLPDEAGSPGMEAGSLRRPPQRERELSVRERARISGADPADPWNSSRGN
jgi:hypothetical protein